MAEMNSQKITSDKEALESITRARKILFIEDDEFVRQIFKAFAAQYDCLLDTAENGMQGLELLQAQEYDIVFLDVRLPDITGNELFRLARVIRPESDFVVISGYLTNEIIGDIQSAGFALFLHKPLGFRNDFLRRLFRTLGVDRLDVTEDQQQVPLLSP